MRQLSLNIYRGKHGGRRPGAGRPRRHSPGVAHQKRASVSARTPVHLNFKLRAGLRSKRALRALQRAVTCARAKGLAVLEYSLQSNHVHLIAEAANNATLTRGMRALTVSFAKNLGTGRVQSERYHLHVLRTVREVRHALAYVLLNERRHSGKRWLRADEFTSLSHRSKLAAWAQALGVTLIRGAPGPVALDPAQSFLARWALRELPG